MKRPRVHKVLESTGPDHAVVFVRGWTSKHSDEKSQQEEWANAIRTAGWNGAVYHLWWDAMGKASRARRVGRGAAAGVAVGAVAGPIGAAMGGFVGSMAGGAVGFDGHFHKSWRRAKKTGKGFAAEAIADRVTESAISLVGFSLGARVIYSMLTKGGGDRLPIADVVLLGGAIRRDSSHDWEGAAEAIEGNLLNLHSKHDDVLKLLKIRRFGEASCGLKPIKNKKKHPRILNKDVSDEVRAHEGLDYLAQIPLFADLLTVQ